MESGILISTPDLRPSLMSILKGLDKASLLKKVVTTTALDPLKAVDKLIIALRNYIPANWSKGVDRRTVPDFLNGKVKIVHARGLVRLMANKLGGDVLAHRAWLWSELDFDRKVAAKFSGCFRYIYGMEHSSLETFTRQKELGGSCILRQVMAHGRTLANVMLRETHKFPEYIDKYMQLLRNDISGVLMRKVAEYGLSDLIVVNSYFARNTFLEAGVSDKKVIAIPTGCPVCYGRLARAGQGKAPLIFLFAGTLSLRKGLPYLLKAWRWLKLGAGAQLWLAGPKELPKNAFKNLEENIHYLGARSKPDLYKLYEQADIMILPTLVEGLAHVILEGLSCGMPVITTEESGCGDFVEHGINGFIVKPADTQALCDAITWCIDNREKLHDMGKASLEKARSWTVEDSNRAHLAAIQKFLKSHEAV